MPTTESERRSWITPGAQDAAQRTYASVQAALKQWAPLRGLDFEVFLQGSYANSTNTRGDSDVDIVVMLKTTFMPDTSRLSTSEKQTWESQRVPGTLTIKDFRSHVHDALVSYYGTVRVQAKDKCIRVAKTEGYVDADVVPAYQYRLYTSYGTWTAPEWIEGISIHPLSGGSIVNYPKVHRVNGSAKNDRCHEDYKPAVRQVKRLRRRAVDLGKVGKSDAPGYLLECMVFNVPDSVFTYDDAARLPGVVGHLHSLSAETMAATFWSCDRIHHLFQDDPGQHNQYTAKRVIDTLWEIL